MKHIIKVASLANLPETRPLIAMNGEGKLFVEGQAAGPQMEFVDLGLSVKWAKYLYGVNPNQLTTASDWYGKYLMWGELEEKAGWDGQGTLVPYDWANYTRHTNGTYSSSNKKVFIKYVPTNKSEYWNGTGVPDNLTTLESVDDVASVNYGGNWRMPTRAECEELLDTTKVTNVWINNYDPNKLVHNPEDDGGISGLNGRLFTSISNGNTLFIPAAGYRFGSNIYNVGSYCYLWSSSLYLGNPGRAYYLYFNSVNISMNSNDRCFGYIVCPVC